MDLLGLVVAALVYALLRIVLAFAAAPLRRKRERLAEGSLEVFAPAELLHRAAEAAAAGDFARAIGALFAAALAALDERGIVPFDGARTPGEYRRLVRRARPPAAPAFDALAGGFVRAMFAPAPPQRADYDAAARAFAVLEPALHGT